MVKKKHVEKGLLIFFLTKYNKERFGGKKIYLARVGRGILVDDVSSMKAVSARLR